MCLGNNRAGGGGVSSGVRQLCLEEGMGSSWEAVLQRFSEHLAEVLSCSSALSPGMEQVLESLMGLMPCWVPHGFGRAVCSICGVSLYMLHVCPQGVHVCGSCVATDRSWQLDSLVGDYMAGEASEVQLSALRMQV